MTQPSPLPRLDPAYDDFLFTQLPENSNGASVSVLSAIARGDRDPWFEAARLARLPKVAATAALALMIAPYVDCSRAEAVPGFAAERLIALLPSSTRPSAAQETAPQKVMDWMTAVCFIVLIVGACLIGLQQQPANVHSPGQADVMPAGGTKASGGL